MDEESHMLNEDSGELPNGTAANSSQSGTMSIQMDPTKIDPTAVVTRTRRVQVKLTGEKLMDKERGLPKLMQISKKRLHISKNKTSYENFNQIIQIYQLWAHQLYPKAKFKDFIKLTQQLGRTDKELREFRKNVIRQELGLIFQGDEDNHLSEERNPIEKDTVPTTTTENESNNNTGIPTSPPPVIATDGDIDNNNNEGEGEGEDVVPSKRKSVFVPEDDDSEDDDLYSLAAPRPPTFAPTTTEDEIQQLEKEHELDINNIENIPSNVKEDEFDEDEEAMEAMREFDI